MSEVRLEEDLYYKAILAIDKIVAQVHDAKTRSDTLVRVKQHYDARVEQNLYTPPEGDWLDG